MTVSRRGLLTGLGSLLAAPAIVRASSLMAVKPWLDLPCDLRPGAINYVEEALWTQYREQLIRVFERDQWHKSLCLVPLGSVSS